VLVLQDGDGNYRMQRITSSPHDVVYIATRQQFYIVQNEAQIPFVSDFMQTWCVQSKSCILYMFSTRFLLSGVSLTHSIQLVERVASFNVEPVEYEHETTCLHDVDLIQSGA